MRVARPVIGALLAVALCASPAPGGADFVELSWVRGSSSANLLRTRVSGPSEVSSPVAVAPGGAAVAVCDAGAIRILPGELGFVSARAAAFSPDGKQVAVALRTGEIIAVDLDAGARTVLGRMRGAERLAWGSGLVAAGKGGAVLLPNRVLTRAPVRAVAATRDRIAVAAGAQVLLFDGAGALLRRVRAPASALALSGKGRLAWAAGREVWIAEPDSAPRRVARERVPVRQILFAGESAGWVADGARAEGRRLDCARFLDATRGLLATCPKRVVAWDGAERTVHAPGDCNVTAVWAVPLGDGLLVAGLLRDRRQLVPCGEKSN